MAPLGVVPDDEAEMAARAAARDTRVKWANSSCSTVAKKLSATALSQQSPLPLMLATAPCWARSARYAPLDWVEAAAIEPAARNFWGGVRFERRPGPDSGGAQAPPGTAALSDLGLRHRVEAILKKRGKTIAATAIATYMERGMS
jgi:hypothetical protein